jgi:hypothetical protein
MAEIKITPGRVSLAKFREVVEAYRVYDEAMRTHRNEEGHFPEHEEILLQSLERKVIVWLQSVLKP